MNRHETQVPAAYDAFLHGWEKFRLATAESYDTAIPFFERAIALDPEYGRAYAALALVHFWRGWTNWERGITDFETQTREAIKRNLHEAKKHPTSTSHQVAGLVAEGYDIYWDAISEFNAAIALDPSDSRSYAFMAQALVFAGRPAEALPYIKTAMRIDPHYPPLFLTFLGFAQFGREQYQEAAVTFEQATRLDPGDAGCLLLLGATYGYLGRQDDAKRAIAAYNALRPGQPPVTATYAWNTWSYAKRPDRDRLFNGLILAGVPERVAPK